MSLIPHHSHDEICAYCEDKLKDTHPYLIKWFRKVKQRHPQTHISCSHRDKDSQERAFAEGRTHLHFPASKHNTLPAEALDLFELTDTGTAQFATSFYQKIADECRADRDEIIAGINFRSIGDSDHFQLHQAI